MKEEEIKRKTYSERVNNHSCLIAKKLLNLMQEKKTNLCVSVDVLNKSSFLRIVNAVADHVCMIKTHIDIIQDFDQDLIDKLIKLSKEKNFIIFEDRKFADIGNTVKYQYSSGIYKIADWSDITNAHTVPGEGVITGLAEIGKPKGRGLLLLAEMSSKGNLAKDDYTIQTVKMANKFKDFVIGFISQRRLESILTESDNSDFLILSPGVALDIKNDQLGQNYRTPHQVICESGADIIIVGRAIYNQNQSLDDSSSDKIITEQAIRYKQAGWQAYLQRQTSPSS